MFAYPRQPSDRLTAPGSTCSLRTLPIIAASAWSIESKSELPSLFSGFPIRIPVRDNLHGPDYQRLVGSADDPTTAQMFHWPADEGLIRFDNVRPRRSPIIDHAQSQAIEHDPSRTTGPTAQLALPWKRTEARCQHGDEVGRPAPLLNWNVGPLHQRAGER